MEDDRQGLGQCVELSEGDGEWEAQMVESGERVTRAYTTLHIAAGRGHLEIVTLLLDHGADLQRQSTGFCGCSPPRSEWEKIEREWAYDY